MTEEVRNFIETNYQLLDSDAVEFCHSAYNGLTHYQQKELSDVLDSAGINIDKAKEIFIRFHIGMTMEIVERPVRLRVLVAQYFANILGLDDEWIMEYIKDNRSEWEDTVEIHADRNGNWMVYPKV